MHQNKMNIIFYLINTSKQANSTFIRLDLNCNRDIKMLTYFKLQLASFSGYKHEFVQNLFK
jgi:hypothetical protein